MNLQSYEHGLVVRIIAYDAFYSFSHCIFHIELGTQWIFLDPFSIIYFSSFLVTVLTKLVADIFSTTSSNYRVKHSY